MSSIEIYIISLQRSEDELAALGATLSPEERLRADRFMAQELRDYFVAGRGMLRRLLGGALGIAPEAVELRYGPQGKPELALEPPAGLRFNLAHSRALAILALGRGLGEAQLGVDLEAQAPLSRMDPLARRFFSEQEYSAWRALPEPWRLRGFYACWTRKEAVLKALGTGLSRPTRSVEVSVEPDAPAQLLAIDGQATAAQGWQLRDMEVAEGFTATLALDRQIDELVLLRA